MKSKLPVAMFFLAAVSAAAVMAEDRSERPFKEPVTSDPAEFNPKIQELEGRLNEAIMKFEGAKLSAEQLNNIDIQIEESRGILEKTRADLEQSKQLRNAVKGDIINIRAEVEDAERETYSLREGRIQKPADYEELWKQPLSEDKEPGSGTADERRRTAEDSGRKNDETKLREKDLGELRKMLESAKLQFRSRGPSPAEEELLNRQIKESNDRIDNAYGENPGEDDAGVNSETREKIKLVNQIEIIRNSAAEYPRVRKKDKALPGGGYGHLESEKE